MFTAPINPSPTFDYPPDDDPSLRLLYHPAHPCVSLSPGREIACDEIVLWDEKAPADTCAGQLKRRSMTVLGVAGGMRTTAEMRALARAMLDFADLIDAREEAR